MSNAKRLFALSMVVAAVVGSATASAAPKNARGAAAAAQPVQVGVDLPLSGALTQLGLDARRGIEVAGIIASQTVLKARTIRGPKVKGKVKLTKLKGYDLQFDFQDDAFDKARAVVNFQHFLSNNVSAIVGPLGSLISGSALPIAQQAQIPALTMSAPDNGITNIGDYVFATLPALVSSVPPAWLKALDKAKIKYTRSAIFVMSSYDVGRNETDRLTQLLAKKKIKPVLTGQFGTNDTDFSAQVALVQNAKPTVIFVSGALPAAGLLVKQLRSAGITATVVGDVTTALPSFKDQAGSAAEGVIGMVFWYPDNPDQTPQSKKFTATYRARYHAEPTQYSAIGYDSVMALANAVRKADSTDPKKVRNALGSLKPFAGAMGPSLRFAADRTITGDALPVTWKNGVLVAFGAGR